MADKENTAMISVPISTQGRNLCRFSNSSACSIIL